MRVKRSTSGVVSLAGHGDDEVVILCQAAFAPAAAWTHTPYRGRGGLQHGGWNLDPELEYLFLWKLDCSCNLYKIALFRKQ